MNLLDKSRIVAPPGFNRWRVPPASVAIHLCIGSVYAWSLFNPPLTRTVGVVAPAAGDWSLEQVVWIFTIAIVFLGLSATFAGKWLEKAGPRKVGTTAALCWGGGFLVAAAGTQWHQLWLVYLGYGVIGGCGLGLGYVSPVSTLIKWFPDRRGMAAGMAIMGFGGGAMVATPLNEALLARFALSPEFLGTEGSVKTETRGGITYAVDSSVNRTREVVILDTASARKLGSGVSPGVYAAGTGSTGIVETFVVLGCGYCLIMLAAAFAFRIPPEGWKPPGWEPPAETSSAMITRHNVDADTALRTPQFYLLWTVLCLNVSAGIGVLAVAKTMMTDIFGSAYPNVVTAGFASTYVLLISVFNMAGRFFWASMSDKLGRKRVYTIFFVLGMALYAAIPFIGHQASATRAIVWLAGFYGVTMLIFSMYGGGFATIPAYISDLFGTKNVGAIHGRLLTAWSTAGVLGPLAITRLRESSRLSAIRKLASDVDRIDFWKRFGEPVDKLEELIRTNVVTIPRLLELAPSAVDPTPTLYDTTMYAMAGLLGIALVANLLVRPVNTKYFADSDRI
ncbi:MFS transporter [bacterium]|nr:MFS transporter [bacterium]